MPASVSLVKLTQYIDTLYAVLSEKWTWTTLEFARAAIIGAAEFKPERSVKQVGMIYIHQFYLIELSASSDKGNNNCNCYDKKLFIYWNSGRNVESPAYMHVHQSTA